LIRVSGAACAALLLVVSMAMSGCADPDPAVETQVPLADGSATQFSHWDGRWILVNYWAEWCAPCRKEIPELNRLHAERNASGVVVVGVNYDGLTGEKLRTLVDEMEIRFPVLVDDPRLRWNAEQPSVLPTTLVIGPDGQLKDVLVGPHTYESFSRAMQLTTAT
jgi:thiol-disulfide isomerase/thioredoxin